MRSNHTAQSFSHSTNQQGSHFCWGTAICRHCIRCWDYKGKHAQSQGKTYVKKRQFKYAPWTLGIQWSFYFRSPWNQYKGWINAHKSWCWESSWLWWAWNKWTDFSGITGWVNQMWIVRKHLRMMLRFLVWETSWAVTLCQTKKGREEDCCGRKLMNSVWKLLSQKCLRGQQRRLRRKMKSENEASWESRIQEEARGDWYCQTLQKSVLGISTFNFSVFPPLISIDPQTIPPSG